MTDIIIIGGGPAGLTASIYAARGGKSVLLFEKESFGGQISKSHKVENYPALMQISGMEFSESLRSQAESFGVEFKKLKVTKAEEKDGCFSVTADKEYTCRALIFALGTEPKKSGLENESQFVGRGLSYCATCDGNFFRNRDVMVVGGGNTALQDALYLSDISKKVYLLHRRDTFRGEENLVIKLKEKDNVEFILNSTLLCAEGKPILKKVTVENRETKEKREVEISGLFLAIGQTPLTADFSDILPLDESGYIICGENCTVKDGIYVCGDCRQKEIRQLTTAAADGSVAATKAVEFV